MKWLTLMALPFVVACDPGATQAENHIRSMLIDPDSAHFETWYVPETGAYCGFVNARNRFGGYTGDQWFAVNDGVAIIMPDFAAEVAKATALIRNAKNEKDLVEAKEALEEARKSIEIAKELRVMCGHKLD